MKRENIIKNMLEKSNIFIERMLKRSSRRIEIELFEETFMLEFYLTVSDTNIQYIDYSYMKSNII